MKESYVFLAEGFEEVEALTAVDILRRAELSVKTVSISSTKEVAGAHGVKVVADLLFAEANCDEARWLVLPGGMPGATNLYECEPLRKALAAAAEREDGRIAAICAAPAVVLGQMGLLMGEKATCYPGFEKMLEGAEVVDSPVVVSGKFVLGNGPANAMLWALTIVRTECGIDVADSIASGLLFFPLLGN